MKLSKPDPYRTFIFLCLLATAVYLTIEIEFTWILSREWLFYFNNRDWYTAAFCILPSVMGHLATIWGHYFRSEREFQHSIAKVTTPVSVRQKISLWEHHIWLGYTVKYWVLVVFVVAMNVSWGFIMSVPFYPRYMDRKKYSAMAGWGLIVGRIGGYNSIASCGLILFLVLRRSMLHALGFTYSEILPLHRWLGVGIWFWAAIHTVGYILYYAWKDALSHEFNFYDVGRSSMNICGCFAFGALTILGLTSIPQIRRRLYGWFMAVHRVMTAIFFVGTIVHYPYYMLWYYLLPSTILFMIDRFVPKMMRARSISPEATCTLNVDADIVRMTFTSAEPMKPYYPGDYILVQIPELGTLYHPFTIASYWPEDPHSLVLFIRTYEESKASWTGALGRACGKEDKRIRIKANIDGYFGDRRHDYLKSEVLVLFAAGAAITTFMALIKAIAAQIASSDEPLRMQLHLVCTFRTRSELHAYGSFLHQITRDPRFTTWLHVEIYVSRPDKPQTLMGPHAHVVKNDIMIASPNIKKSKKRRFASLRRTGTMLKRALSGRTIVGSPVEAKGAVAAVQEPASMRFSVGQHVRSSSVDTVVEGHEEEEGQKSPSSSSSNTASRRTSNSIHEITKAGDPTTRAMTYESKGLPTFQDSNSGSVATQMAKLDLTASILLTVIPLALWYGLRAVKWEGNPNYCDVRGKMNQWQMMVCYGTYSVLPEAGHLLAMSLIGYFAVWLARRTLLRRGSDLETGLPFPDLAAEDEKLSVEDGNWDEGDVVYSIGRMDVKKIIARFMEKDIGTNVKERGLVSVFGGGPEAFVDHLERQVKVAKWSVDFHRETWAP